MKRNRWIGRLLALVAAALLPASGAWAMTIDEFMTRIKDGSLSWEEKAKLWQKAGQEMGAGEIPALAALMTKQDTDQEKNAAKMAATLLDMIAHNAKRPGAARELGAVNRELVKLTGSNQPEGLRIKSLELLASTAGDDEVPAIAALLRDPDAKMRERARWSLRRIPGSASNQALLAALPAAPPEFRRDLILTLGEKKAGEAVATLLGEARSRNETIRLAAVEALARIGDSRGRQAIEESISTFRGMDRRTALDSYLQLADRLAIGDGRAATNIYRTVLQKGQDDAVRCAALVGLGKAGESDMLPILVETLGDASTKVRNAAASALVDMKGAGTNGTLVETARGASPARKAMLLRVLAARQAPQAAALLKEASRDSNAEVRVTALDLLGGLDAPGLEGTLLEAAEKGSPAVRPIALRSYTRLAETRLKDGKKAEALTMYHRVLELAVTDDVRRAALSGIAGIASADSLSKVEALMGEGSGVRDDATRAYIEIVAAMAEAGKKDEAIARLTKVVDGTRNHAVAMQAILELRKLGADTAGFAAKAGFITRWWLAGPFPFGGDASFDKSYLDEANVDPRKPVAFGGKTIEWKRVQTDDARGKVVLEREFSPKDNVAAYAYAELQSPREREVNLRVGSDDGFILWLNGKRIGANNATRAFNVDQDTVKARLTQGTNRVLMKITQGGGEWEFCLRVANLQNKPLDLTRWGETAR